jgi:transcriptional regulator with XRE-family HTH domain
MNLSELMSEEVRAAMARRRLSVSDLATCLGVSMTTASRLLRGARRWSLDGAGRAANMLDINVADLTAEFASVSSERAA